MVSQNGEGRTNQDAEGHTKVQWKLLMACKALRGQTLTPRALYDALHYHLELLQQLQWKPERNDALPGLPMPLHRRCHRAGPVQCPARCSGPPRRRQRPELSPGPGPQPTTHSPRSPAPPGSPRCKGKATVPGSSGQQRGILQRVAREGRSMRRHAGRWALEYTQSENLSFSSWTTWNARLRPWSVWHGTGECVRTRLALWCSRDRVENLTDTAVLGHFLRSRLRFQTSQPIWNVAMSQHDTLSTSDCLIIILPSTHVESQFHLLMWHPHVLSWTSVCEPLGIAASLVSSSPAFVRAFHSNRSFSTLL